MIWAIRLLGPNLMRKKYGKMKLMTRVRLASTRTREWGRSQYSGSACRLFRWPNTAVCNGFRGVVLCRQNHGLFVTNNVFFLIYLFFFFISSRQILRSPIKNFKLFSHIIVISNLIFWFLNVVFGFICKI